jgi:hypothetical protein
MTGSKTTFTATFTTAALMSAKAKSERLCAQAALARYAQEFASRLAREARNDRAAIDSPLFANV